MRDLPGDRAEIERRLSRLWGSARHGARDRFADAADAHPQRADTADARSRLWQGLRLRPRHRGRVLGPELFPRWGSPSEFLSPRRTRVRARDQETARLLGQAAPTG